MPARHDGSARCDDDLRSSVHEARHTGAVDTVVRRFADLAAEVAALPGAVRLVGVDGCGGAGKTTFAERLAHAAGGAPVVHTDDFASWDVPMQWWPRMLEQVVEPLLRAEPSTYRPYDWTARRFADETVVVEPAPIVVIEGVGATRSAWRQRLASALWVDAPRELRLARGLARDGDHMLGFWQWWMSEEDEYVAQDLPREHADLVVCGAPTLVHDPATQFVSVNGRR